MDKDLKEIAERYSLAVWGASIENSQMSEEEKQKLYTALSLIESTITELKSQVPPPSDN